MKLRDLVRPHLGWITGIICLISCRTILLFAGPVVLKSIIDNIEKGRLNGHIYALVAVFIVSFLLFHFFTYLYNRIYAKFMLYFKTTTSVNIYNELFRVNYPDIQKKDPTYFVSRIKQFADNAFTLVGDNVGNAVISVVTICVSLFFISTISFKLFSLALLLLPVSYFGYKKVNAVLRDKCQGLQHLCSENFKNIINVIQNIEEIKQLHNYPVFSGIIGRYVEVIEKENSDMNLYSRSIALAVSFLVELLKNSILLAAIYLLYVHSITFSSLIFMTMILSIYFGALTDLNKVNVGLGDINASLKFLEDSVLSLRERDSGERPLPAVEDIALDIPSFTYPGGKRVLQNIVLNFRRGEKLALVGKSGCGKSTLIRLLNRLYESGGISINGAAIGEYPLAELRKKIHVVSQSAKLFPGSVKDNITIGLDADRAEKFAAIAELPFLREFAMAPEGFDAPVREGGANFSGGQKQKIMIARMLLRNPDVIVFDESTSAVDSRGEEEIFGAIAHMLKDKVVIYISHRLSTLKRCDSVVVIKDGTVEQACSIKDVLGQDGEFKDIFAAQMG